MITSPGSSPHARGTPATPHRSAPGPRFIPACAGNAWLRSMRCRPSSVHPRMRGERQFWADSGRRRYGSSPHARGTPHGIRWFENPIRFIPACAGNAPVWAAARLRAAVHPRMRGERAPRAARTRAPRGSSPHARGTRPTRCPTGRWSSVHPRMRGERATDHQAVILAGGSSPHARGTQPEPDPNAQPDRFIPACAGNAAGP